LLCGTPVIAFRRGGVPEGIEEGLTGFVCDTTEQMMTAVCRIGELDRAQCRASAERRFSRQAIVDEYEGLYRQLRAS
jgi:glycosyltransferase involved in cell wall biosynthesis